MSDKTDDWEEGEEAGSAFGFRDILEIARRRAMLIGCVVIGIVALVGAASFLLPNQYQATATIQLTPRETKIVSIDSVIKDIKGDTPTIDDVMTLDILAATEEIRKKVEEEEAAAKKN